jgi:hypothetical protein
VIGVEPRPCAPSERVQVRIDGWPGLGYFYLTACEAARMMQQDRIVRFHQAAREEFRYQDPPHANMGGIIRSRPDHAQGQDDPRADVGPGPAATGVLRLGRWVRDCWYVFRTALEAKRIRAYLRGRRR